MASLQQVLRSLVCASGFIIKRVVCGVTYVKK